MTGEGANQVTSSSTRVMMWKKMENKHSRLHALKKET